MDALNTFLGMTLRGGLLVLALLATLLVAGVVTGGGQITTTTLALVAFVGFVAKKTFVR